MMNPGLPILKIFSTQWVFTLCFFLMGTRLDSLEQETFLDRNHPKVKQELAQLKLEEPSAEDLKISSLALVWRNYYRFEENGAELAKSKVLGMGQIGSLEFDKRVEKVFAWEKAIKQILEKLNRLAKGPGKEEKEANKRRAQKNLTQIETDFAAWRKSELLNDWSPDRFNWVALGIGRERVKQEMGNPLEALGGRIWIYPDGTKFYFEKNILVYWEWARGAIKGIPLKKPAIRD